MAQTFTHISDQRSAQQQLRLEKLGVIAGFLLGVVLSAGVVSTGLGAVDAPDVLSVLAIGLTVAVTTRLGLFAAAAASRKLAA